jgi:UDP-glucose 4-epimerase
MMKILILGSEGFIGSHCVDHFLPKNVALFGVDIKDYPRADYNYRKVLPHFKEYDSLFSEIKPDACIFATGSASVGISLEEPVADFEYNTLMVMRVLQAIKKNSPACKFLNTSSAAVYGNPELMPVKENSAIQPVSPYGWHKYYSELLCKEYFSLYNIQTCSIRPFSVYGPRQTKLLFWDLYNKAKKEGGAELFGTGNETRDFLYVTDLVQAIDLILHKAPMKAEAYNVAAGIERTISEVSQIFLKSIGYNGSVRFNKISKLGDPVKWVADTSQIRQLGFEPLTGIDAGLKLYAEWLKENA